MTIAALIVAIIGLSIGFAAFSNTLTIRSTASVNPTNTMNVVFSTSSSSAQLGNIAPSNALYGGTANIKSTDATVLENLSATFTAPGQSVTYETSLYVYNAGQLQAQLTGITFEDADGSQEGDTDLWKHCAAITENVELANQATPSLVDSACEGISIKVTVGTAYDVTPTTTGDKAALNYQLINVGASLPVSVTISYDDGAAYVDGPMEVEFGTIQIIATSAVNPALVVVPQQPAEPQQEIVDPLIPTSAQLAKTTIDSNSGLNVFTANGEIMYGMNTVFILYNNAGYMWICDAETAADASQHTGLTLEANKWYNTDSDVQPTTLYTGPSPISLSSLNIQDSDIEAYVTRVINSFSNNG